MPVHLLRYLLRQEALPADSMTFRPAGDLHSVVEGFWLFGKEAIMPASLLFSDGVPALVFCLDEQLRPFDGWCSAQMLLNVHLRPSAHAMLIVRFTATGFYMLAPEKLPVLRCQPVWPLGEVLGRDWAALLHAAETPEKMIGMISALIRRDMQQQRMPPPLLETAVENIRRAKGAVSIETLAGSLQVNYKWLERQFITFTGISPKEYARLQRFLHAYFHLRNTNGRDLMGTAVRNGYYDQNHFTKEFRQFAGKSPLAYLRQCS